MKRVGCIAGIVAGALLGAGVADAAPTLRLQVDQSGDFVMIGNTLAHDCAIGVPDPVVGTVGNCGTNVTDSSPDVFWRADDAADAAANNTITLGQSRSTAVLDLPVGAVVTHAFLYWAGESTEGNQADLTATLDRPGVFSEDITAVRSATSTYSGTDFYYQSVADVTQLLQQHGSGAYRVSGVQTRNLAGLSDEVVFANWTLVVFYQLDTDPPRNLTIFDGLDLVEPGENAAATLSGFLVPNAGFDAKLGVIAYEGDGNITGDQLRFGTGTLGLNDRLSDDENPLTNFFNSTRSTLGTPVSNVGDLPQLTGTSRSMGSFDIDVVDITSRLDLGDDSANIEAITTQDVFFLGAFVTSISTYKPNFAASTKTVTDVDGGGLLPGDVLRYTIDVANAGNDTAVNVELADQLPPGVSFRPGTLEIVSGPNTGIKSDAADTDQAEFDSGSNTVYFRLGDGADGTMGGSLPIGGTTTVQFEVVLDANASGTIENQAIITAEGDQGAPQENTPTDGNGSGPGTPPTVVEIDACGVDADCSDPSLPFCATVPNPNICAECLTSANCSGTTPVCDASFTCVACTSDAGCPSATPACQPSGACGQCSATNNTQCTGTTPVCDVAAGTCIGCTSDSNCSGATPACQPSGACGQCSATNTSACTGDTPLCNVTSGTCVECVTGADCGGTAPVCSGGACVGCSSDDDCSGATPACAASGACVECTSDTHCSGLTPTCDTESNTCSCVASGAEVCGNLIDEDCDGQIDNGCQDTDGDGLSDQTEAVIGTDPNDADSDDDGVPDGEEIEPGTDTDGDGLINALDPDSDNDGLFDGTEMGYGCSAAATDLSAGRCIPDGDLGTTKTDPLNADTDGGGVTDGSEDANLNGVVDTGETDPTEGNGADDATVVDTDGDGLSDALENFLGSDPNDGDSDDDGLFDGQEPNPSDDNDRDGVINLLDVDSDNDGLFDGTEMGKTCDDEATDATVGHCIADGDAGETTTSPLLWDTDGGGEGDGSEDFNLNGAVDSDETNPTTGNGADDGTVVDSDGDGLSDGLEAFLESDPNDADSDDDGLLDGQEFNPSADTDRDGDRNVIDPDSDGDGLFDGMEAGKDCSDDATDPEASTCVADGDQGATTTSPLLSDTDGGGISDGVEDTNKNGVADPGERDPNDPVDDMMGEPCENDGQCGGPTSGIVCDGTTCVPGCRGESGNGCPDGEVCTSVDETIGECVPESDGGTGGTGGTGGAGGTGGVGGAGGTSGTGGTAGTGATGGTGGTGGASGTGGGADAGTDDVGVLEGGGCSCTVPGSGSAPLGLGLLTVLAGLMGLRSRRRP